jgi:NTP pyrophosphatase (non-canonical NTP hydrolase)
VSRDDDEDPAFNEISNAEAEAIALCAEECGEAVQAAMKILRHGLECYDPGATHTRNNRQDLERELGQVLAAIEVLKANGIVFADGLAEAKKDKLAHVGNYLHHAKMPRGHS